MRAALIALATSLWWLASVPGALAIYDEPAFADPRQQALYERVTDELRCLVCQNQTIADSNAMLAADLRTQVREMIEQGASYDDIMTFMTARYGDFVRYRPPWNARTWMLWTGPLLFLVAGITIGGLVIRRQAALPVDSPHTGAPDSKAVDAGPPGTGGPN